MGVREFFSALGRRWYVVLVGVALTLGAGWYIYDTNSPDYTASGLVLLLPPTGTGEDAGSNPFLQLGGLELTARVLVATYSSTTFVDEVEARSPDAEVEVSVDESTRGGVILVDVTDTSAQGSLDLLDFVTTDVSARLAALQEQVGVEDAATVRSMLLAKDAEAEPDFQSLIRILVIAVGGGLAATLGIALLVDVIIERRHGRRGLRGDRPRAGGRRGSTRTRALSSEDEVSTPDEQGASAEERPDGVDCDDDPAAAGDGEAVRGRQAAATPRSARRIDSPR